MKNRQSKIGNRKSIPTIEETGGRHRCRKHPERYADAVTDKCWECYLGRTRFEIKFRMSPEIYYGEDGPGYAGKK